MSVAVVALGAAPAPAETTSLDGIWSFAVDSTGAFTVESVVERAAWRPAKVPAGWQSQFDDLRDYQGVAWYCREVDVERPPQDHEVVLRFDAVDYRTDVYLNRRLLMTHEGGYTPFEVPCGDALREGMNEIILRVMDPVWSGSGTEGINYKQIPHGKQSWYIQTSGPWQSVSLSTVPARRILAARFTPELSGRVLCQVVLSQGVTEKTGEEIRLEVRDPDGEKAVSSVRRVEKGVDTLRWTETVPKPELWSPDAPWLYTATVRLGDSPGIVERFGFRTFEARGGLLLLNGEPFYMIGALDQDFYPEAVYSTPSRDILKEQMLAAKALGLNTLRCHIKVPDPRYLEVADEVGVLVWYEIPNWDEWTRDAARRSRETLDRMLDRDWNHPSLVAISIINESWGIDLAQEEQRWWLAGEVAYARQRAPGRLIVDNSACWGNFHVDTDIADWHTYYAIPERRAEFDRTVAEYASRPAWLFSSHGDARIRGDEPLVLSEFGTWGLPELPSPGPWWLERGFFDNYVVHPRDYDRRFVEFGFDAVFGSYTRFAAESQRAQSDALKYQIEQIRLTPGLTGYVITEFTDIMWECNGLLDMWRRPKECRMVLPMIQQQDMIAIRPDAHAVYAADTARFRLWFSHFSAADLTGARVIWSWGGGAEQSEALPPCARGGVVQLASVSVPAGLSADESGTPVERSLSVRVVSADGVELARNSQPVTVYPASGSLEWPAVRVHDPSGTLARAAAVAGAPTDAGARAGAGSGATPVTVTNLLDGETLAALRDGGTVLCLVDSHTVAPAGFPLTVIARDSAYYDGNWASVMNWVDARSPVIGWLPTAPRMGFAPSATGLPYVLGGIGKDWKADVHAGLFIGWLHSNAAYIAQLNVGRGKLLLCTIPVAGVAGVDPFATRLYHALLRHAAGGGMQPRQSWNP
jgi:hypothetical protein